MKVRMVFDFTDEQRRAIAAHYGQRGPATRADIRAWIDGQVQACLDDVLSDAETARDAESAQTGVDTP